MLLRMLPIQLKNLLKEFKNKFFKNQKFEIKEKRINES